MLPELDVARVRRWADQLVPDHASEEIRMELDVDARSITILECRPPWRPGRVGDEWTRFPIARLRYTKTRGEWTLYWRDRNLKFHRYDLIQPSPNVGDLIAEVDQTRRASSRGRTIAAVNVRSARRAVPNRSTFIGGSANTRCRMMAQNLTRYPAAFGSAAFSPESSSRCS
jgi:hypothetical protein